MSGFSGQRFSNWADAWAAWRNACLLETTQGDLSEHSLAPLIVSTDTLQSRVEEYHASLRPVASAPSVPTPTVAPSAIAAPAVAPAAVATPAVAAPAVATPVVAAPVVVAPAATPVTYAALAPAATPIAHTAPAVVPAADAAATAAVLDNAATAATMLNGMAALAQAAPPPVHPAHWYDEADPRAWVIIRGVRPSVQYTRCVLSPSYTT